MIAPGRSGRGQAIAAIARPRSLGLAAVRTTPIAAYFAGGQGDEDDPDHDLQPPVYLGFAAVGRLDGDREHDQPGVDLLTVPAATAVAAA